MVAKRAGGLAALILAALWLPMFGIEDAEFARRLKSLGATCEGLSVEAQRRVVTRFGDDALGASIHVTSAVIRAIKQGARLPACRLNEFFHWPDPYFKAECANGLGPNQYDGTWACAEKDYQWARIRYDVLLGSPDPNDLPRQGESISFEGTVVGLGWGFREVYVVGAEITRETPTVCCPDGHRYPASEGLKACPRCGKPLK
jgi:hypothetical protein